MGVKEFYEAMYGETSTASSGSSFLYRKLKRFELNRYELAYQATPGGNRALDIGCGDGELLLMLAGDKYSEVWGLDIAKPRIDRIQKKLDSESNIHLVVGDANEQLDFKDDFFDTVTAISTLEHIFDPYQFIRECHRVLRRGGA